MARPYAVVVTMACQFQGKEDEFSNVFHYLNDTIIDTQAGWESLADQVVAGIRPLFSGGVTFKRVRVHGPTDGTKQEDQMRLVKDLTGTGTTTGTIAMFPESVLLARRYVGRGPNGGKQILRKFFHCLAVPGTGVSNEMARGVSALPSTAKTPITSALDSINSINVGGAPNIMCTPKGKVPPGGEAWTVAPYVSTRQFKRGRKETP